EAVAEGAELFRFEDGPVLPAEGAGLVVAHPAKVVAVELLLAGRGDDADLLDPGVNRLFADDLDDRLGQAVAVNQGEHFLLYRGRGRVLAGALAGGGDDGLADLGHV